MSIMTERPAVGKAVASSRFDDVDGIETPFAREMKVLPPLRDRTVGVDQMVDERRRRTAALQVTNALLRRHAATALTDSLHAGMVVDTLRECAVLESDTDLVAETDLYNAAGVAIRSLRQECRDSAHARALSGFVDELMVADYDAAVENHRDLSVHFDLMLRRAILTYLDVLSGMKVLSDREVVHLEQAIDTRGAHTVLPENSPSPGAEWRTVTDYFRHGGSDSFMVCPSCWPAHQRETVRGVPGTQVALDPPYAELDRCHWCDERRAS